MSCWHLSMTRKNVVKLRNVVIEINSSKIICYVMIEFFSNIQAPKNIRFRSSLSTMIPSYKSCVGPADELGRSFYAGAPETHSTLP